MEQKYMRSLKKHIEELEKSLLEDELEESDSKKLQELISKVDEEFDDKSSDSNIDHRPDNGF